MNAPCDAEIYKYYSGIGSRSTPPEILDKMRDIAKYLAGKEYTLRSGGADGADEAFEFGCDLVDSDKQIFLPWKNFNGNPSPLLFSKINWDLAEKFHPKWDNLSLPVRQLIARNSAQILGLAHDEPSKFVLCWTEGGKMVGGTSQALRIAKDYNIPIFNFGFKNGVDKFRQYCKNNLK